MIMREVFQKLFCSRVVVAPVFIPSAQEVQAGITLSSTNLLYRANSKALLL